MISLETNTGKFRTLPPPTGASVIDTLGVRGVVNVMNITYKVYNVQETNDGLT